MRLRPKVREIDIVRTADAFCVIDRIDITTHICRMAADDAIAEAVRDAGGVVGVREMTGILMERGFTLTEKEVAALHTELDGPEVSGRKLFTADTAAQLEEELEGEGDGDDDAAAETGDDGCDGVDCDCPEHEGKTCDDDDCPCEAGHDDDEDEE